MKLHSTPIIYLPLSMLIFLLSASAAEFINTTTDVHNSVEIGRGATVAIDNSLRIGKNTTYHALGTVPDVASRLKVNGTRAKLTLGGTWQNASDRNIKENFSPIDEDEILAKVIELPITEWNYIEEQDKITHIGPMAQDFYAAFGLGGDDKSISTIDPAGVALVSIKALARKQKELDALRDEVNVLRRMVREIGLEMRAIKEGKPVKSGK